MDIESQLKNLKNYRIRPQNANFEENLRKRLLNQFESADLSHPQTNQEKSSFFQNLNIFSKFQSAFSLGMVIFASVSFFSVAAAAYVALPEDVKDSIRYSLADQYAVRINANVENANVFVNGSFKGTTPLKIGLESGHYSVRIEKDGFGVYSSNLSVEDNSSVINAQLQERKLDNDSVHWLSYSNDKLNVAFNYPSDWHIDEISNELDYNNNFVVSVSKDDNKIEFVINPSEDFELMHDTNISSYKREINVTDLLRSRFLQFDGEGNYLNGGLQIDLTEKQRSIRIVYKLNGKESEILVSDILDSMDKIAQTLVVNELNPVLAFVDDKSISQSENIKVDLNKDDSIASQIEKLPSPTIGVTPELEDGVSQIYKNTIYGYTVQLPEDWDVSTSRADYPLEDRGFEFDDNGNSYEVARLKIRAGDAGSIYLFMSSKDQPIYPSSWENCDGNILKSWDEFAIKKGNGSDYSLQLCDASDGSFNITSKINGNLKYAVFLDIEQEQLNDEVYAQIYKVIKSIKFDDSFIKQPVNAIRNEYSYEGAKFGLRFDWSASESEIDCYSNGVMGKCKSLDIFNNQKSRVVNLIKLGNLENDYSAKYIIEDVKIQTQAGEVVAQNMFEKLCDADGQNCQKGGFKFARLMFGDIEVVYQVRPEGSINIKDLLSSLDMD